MPEQGIGIWGKIYVSDTNGFSAWNAGKNAGRSCWSEGSPFLRRESWQKYHSQHSGHWDGKRCKDDGKTQGNLYNDRGGKYGWGGWRLSQRDIRTACEDHPSVDPGKKWGVVGAGRWTWKPWSYAGCTRPACGGQSFYHKTHCKRVWKVCFRRKKCEPDQQYCPGSYGADGNGKSWDHSWNHRWDKTWSGHCHWCVGGAQHQAVKPDDSGHGYRDQSGQRGWKP